MIVVVLRTKPSGLYRHRRWLGLHRVGYREGDLHIRIARLVFHAKESPTRRRDEVFNLYLHSPTVRPNYIVRLSEDPLIQDSLTLVQTKRVHSRKSPDPITKKPKPTTGRGTVLEGWFNGACQTHTTPDTIPTHSLGACWILRQVAKSGEDLLINHTAEHHPAENNNTVLTVFETFAGSLPPSMERHDHNLQCQ